MEELEARAGLAERVLREVLSTPALKELVLLQLKDIRPEKASGLARTLLWGDPAVSMSLIGALPQVANWLVEFFLELVRQLDSLPEPLLRDLVSAAGSGIETWRFSQLRDTLASLLKKIVAEDGFGAEARAKRLSSALDRLASSLDRLASQLEQRRGEAYLFLRTLRTETDWRRLASSTRRLLKAALSSTRLSDISLGKHRVKREKVLMAALVLFACHSFLKRVFSVKKRPGQRRSDA